MRAFVVATLAALTITGANADVSGNYTILGVAAMGCGTYVKEDIATKTNVDSWLNGYFTAYNLLIPGVANITKDTDVAGRQLWMENWCRAHPLEKIAAGAEELIVEFRNRKGLNKQ